jgi:glycosyltransferase involved in cell wall biosynthesis
VRILLVSPAYPPSPAGEAEHCHQIASRLAAAGHSVHVLTNTHAQPAAPQGFELHAVMRGWRWRHAPALRRHILRLQPEAVVLIYTGWLYSNHPMVTYLPTWLARRQPGVRLLALMELPFPPPRGSLGVRLGRQLATGWAGRAGADPGFGTLLRDAAAVAVLGPSILQALQPHCPGLGERALVIPPPPLVRLPADRSDTTRQATRARLGAGPGTLLLAYFGYVYPGKGVPTLLAALAELRGPPGDARRDVRLVMAGGGRGLPGGADPAQTAFEAQMQALAAQLGVADAVAWPAGHASDSDALGLELLAADLAVLPFDDGAELRRSSIAVVASLGLPLVTTQPRGPEPAFVHGRNVLLCPPGDVHALAEAVRAVAEAPALRARLTAGAQALAHDWFSWDAAIAQMLRALGAVR